MAGALGANHHRPRFLADLGNQRTAHRPERLTNPRHQEIAAAGSIWDDAIVSNFEQTTNGVFVSLDLDFVA
jgi:hypothetical protein